MFRKYIHLLCFLVAKASNLNVLFYQGEPVQVNINDPNSQIKFSQTSDNSLVFQVYSPETDRWTDPMHVSYDGDVKQLISNGGVIHPTSTGGIIAYAPKPEEITNNQNYTSERSYSSSAPASYSEPAPVSYAQPAPASYSQPAPGVVVSSGTPTSGSTGPISGTQSGSGASVSSPTKTESGDMAGTSSKDSKGGKDKDGKNKNEKDKDKEDKDKNSKNLKDKDSNKKNKKKNGVGSILIALSTGISCLSIFAL